MDIIVLLLDMVLMTFCRLESTTAKCDGKFELSGLNHGHLEQGIKNHAIVGHSFKNFTLPKFMIVISSVLTRNVNAKHFKYLGIAVSCWMKIDIQLLMSSYILLDTLTLI